MSPVLVLRVLGATCLTWAPKCYRVVSAGERAIAGVGIGNQSSDPGQNAALSRWMVPNFSLHRAAGTQNPRCNTVRHQLAAMHHAAKRQFHLQQQQQRRRRAPLPATPRTAPQLARPAHPQRAARHRSRRRSSRATVLGRRVLSRWLRLLQAGEIIRHQLPVAQRGLENRRARVPSAVAAGLLPAAAGCGAPLTRASGVPAHVGTARGVG